MLNILQARLQEYMNDELPDIQAGFRKVEEPDIILTTSAWSKKAREFQKIIYFSFIDYAKTCLLRNLYAGYEAIVRTGHKQQTCSK